MTMAQLPNLIPALPEVFLACAIMALLMFGVFQKGDERPDEARAAVLIS